uniref:Uncharacterized protein n=2 Tax=Clytia hemisphaerica TaxID=252671 RepID=A0A7M5UWF4_9CNID
MLRVEILAILVLFVFVVNGKNNGSLTRWIPIVRKGQGNVTRYRVTWAIKRNPKRLKCPNKTSFVKLGTTLIRDKTRNISKPLIFKVSQSCYGESSKALNQKSLVDFTKNNLPWSEVKLTKIQKGRYNRPPVVANGYEVVVMEGCRETVKIPVFDPDGDETKCKLWKSTFGCQSKDDCNQSRYFILDEVNCLLTFTGTVPELSNQSHHTITMNIEDFDQSVTRNKNSSQSLSRVHFVINVKFLTRNNKIDNVCTATPKLIDSILETQCRSVKIGERLKLKFGVKGHADDPIIAINIIGYTLPSKRVTISNLLQTSDGASYKTFEWKTKDKGYQFICYYGISQAGRTSDNVCLLISVGDRLQKSRLGMRSSISRDQAQPITLREILLTFNLPILLKMGKSSIGEISNSKNHSILNLQAGKNVHQLNATSIKIDLSAVPRIRYSIYKAEENFTIKLNEDFVSNKQHCTSLRKKDITIPFLLKFPESAFGNVTGSLTKWKPIIMRKGKTKVNRYRVTWAIKRNPKRIKCPNKTSFVKLGTTLIRDKTRNISRPLMFKVTYSCKKKSSIDLGELSEKKTSLVDFTKNNLPWAEVKLTKIQKGRYNRPPVVANGYEVVVIEGCRGTVKIP